MMKPLNTLVYIRNNPKKVIPQILAVSLGVFLIYFMCIIGGGLRYELNSNIVLPFEKVSEFTVRHPDKDNDDAYNYFSKDSNVEKIMYSSQMRNISAKMLISSCGTSCIFLNENDIEYMMNMYGFKLVDGKLPSSKDEVIFNEDYIKSHGIKVGGYYGTDVNDKDELEGRYKVVGSFKGDMIMSFVCDNDDVDSIKKNGYCLILIAKNGHIAELNKDIHSFMNAHPKQYNSDTYDKQYGFISTMFVMFNAFAVVIMAVTVFVLTFTIGDINYVHFSERLPEFSVLQAVGYSKNHIRYRQFCEMIVIVFLGFCMGIVISLLGGYIFKEIYCVPGGIQLSIISVWYFLMSGLVPMLVSLFSCLSISRLVNKMEPVDVLEGR